MDSSETWKEFDQNPLTHSAAHHLVAIRNLLTDLGYARVSDVASQLKITRGSASITLRRLKERGLVAEDRNKFLKLSDEGERIARSIQAKKYVMKQLFTRLLGVEEAQADVDTCKIEHLVSAGTAERATVLLQFLDARAPAAIAFLEEFRRYAPPPPGADDANADESNLFRYFQAAQNQD